MIVNQKAENLINAIKGMVFLIFLTPLLVVPKSYFPFIFWRTIIFRILVEIIVVVYIILVLEQRKYLPKRSCLILSVVIFWGMLVLTTFTSLNVYHSFWSNQERMEGLFTMTHFVALFLVATGVFRKKEDWYWFFKVSFCVSLIASVYGFLQKIHISWSWVVLGGQDRLSSTIGNPAYFAAYLIPHIFLGVILSRRSQVRSSRIFYLGGVIFELALLYWTATRGALLGLIVAIIFLFLFLFFQRTKRVFKFIGLAFLILFIAFSFLIYHFRDSRILQKSTAIYRLTHISLSGAYDTSTQTRVVVWRMAFNAWQKKPILGWGPENFHAAFNDQLDFKLFNMPGETWYDRAHNKIFDVAVTSGLVGLLSYLAIFVCVVFLLLRHWWRDKRRSWTEPILLAFFLAYFFQNLFVFDTLATYLMFFLLLGFVHVYTSRRLSLSAESDINPKPISDFWSRRSNSIVTVLIIMMIILTIKANIKPAIANYNLAMAFVDIKPDKLTSHFGAAMFMETYVQAEARKEFAQKLIQEIQRLKPDKDVKYTSQIRTMLELAIGQTLQAIKRDPYNPLYSIYVGRLYHLSAEWGDSTATDKATILLNQALQISPRRPELYYELANAQVNLKEYDAAAETYQKLLNLSSDLRDARWGLGTVLSVAGRPKEALAQMLQAKSAGYFNNGLHTMDLFLLAHVYGDLGDYQQALAVYKDYTSRVPEETDGWAALAETYARLGDFSSVQEAANQILKLRPQAAQEVEKFIQKLKIISDKAGIKN
ncbi:MAG: hypothetical protein AUJ33_01640 [Parcubacteria group bacterium CG1_02_40_25]|nr:MAG: hypothetical protein AUJ33_01640 [Parcubacteria group bacterium CG1_02_40_25]